MSKTEQERLHDALTNAIITSSAKKRTETNKAYFWGSNPSNVLNLPQDLYKTVTSKKEKKNNIVANPVELDLESVNLIRQGLSHGLILG